MPIPWYQVEIFQAAGKKEIVMLEEMLSEEMIITPLKSTKKRSVIEEMASRFLETGIVEDRDKLIKALLDREAIESTAIGGGVAIPHARSDAIDGLAMVLGRSQEGVDFDSVDKKPVKLIFMIVSSPGICREYLQVLARIARLCSNEKMREELNKAKNSREIMGIIRGFDAGSGRFENIRLHKGRSVYTNEKKDNKDKG